MNKLTKIKSILTVVLAFLLIFGLSIYSFILPDKKVSLEENRELQQFPDASYENIMKAQDGFMGEFESYSLDQFPLRNAFRQIKEAVVFSVFNQKDNNGYFMRGDYIFKNDNKYNSESVDEFFKKITKYKDTFLTEENNIYFTIVPEKSFYIPEDIKLTYNYERLFAEAAEKLDFATIVGINHLLTLDSYYATDTHWRQEKIANVAEYLLEAMNTQYDSLVFETVSTGKFFDGVYARQTNFKTKGDEMLYLVNDLLSTAVLTDGKGKEVPIYNFDKIDSAEPYDMYMSGAKVGLVTLERKEKTTGRELIVFRDSFGSSIGPLLLAGYDKITFIDTRQIQLLAIKNMVEFTNQDVLFLYSSTVINDCTELNPKKISK